jgi:hypothetical protein
LPQKKDTCFRQKRKFVRKGRIHYVSYIFVTATVFPESLARQQMSRAVLMIGLLLCIVCPLIAGAGLWLAQFMPNCIGGSSGPTSGCYLFGVNFNWLVSLATLAFMASFFTVPLGLLFLFCSAVLGLLESRSDETKDFARASALHGRPYGIYDASNNLLSPSEAATAIQEFDEESCARLLSAFGQPSRSHGETLESLRARCLETLSGPKDPAA